MASSAMGWVRTMTSENRWKLFRVRQLRLSAISNYRQAKYWYAAGKEKRGDRFHKHGDSCSAKADKIEKSIK